MTDKKPLTFCIDWIRDRAEHTPMPASRATMDSIVAYLEELEDLRKLVGHPDPVGPTGESGHRTNGDVAPVVHGRWMEQEDGFGGTYYVCSACGETWILIDGTPMENTMYHCPNCGAKMDETDE